MTDFGEILNTVQGVKCPKCRKRASMTVHPGHRVYRPCGCSYELPPLPQQRLFSDRRQSGTPRKGRR